MSWLPSQPCQAQAKGTIFIDFLEQETGEPLTTRVKIVNEQGREMRARGVLFERGWNLVEGPLEFKNRPGDYHYEAFHGPEFSAASGGFTLDRNAEGVDRVDLPRHANLLEEGWLGGDLLAHVAPDETARWLAAEALHMAVVSQPSATSTVNPPVDAGLSRWVEPCSYFDDRSGSGLVLHHWMPPADVPPAVPSSQLLMMAKQGVSQLDGLPTLVEIQKLWARDVPIWLASGRVDCIQLLSEHLTYDGTQVPDVTPLVVPDGHFRGALGPGKMVEKIYWQVLEAGLAIPPTAGSGFGRSPSPLGYNRVYAAVGSRTPATWWDAIRRGQSFVTNGPLLRTLVNGQLPGHRFEVPAGEQLELDVALTLTVADPVEYLDVIFNGQTLYQARLDEHARRGGRIPTLQVADSGWLVVRVVTERDFTYRMASTAPYYVVVGEQPRISRGAVRYFQEWLEKSAELIQAMDAPARQAALPYLESARKFWQRQLELGTAD